MILDRVTLTSADDSVDPTKLVDLALAYPFSEWGILFARDTQGGEKDWGTRFPSFDWIEEFLRVAPKEVNLCAHLCGHYVYELLANDRLTFAEITQFDPQRFQRIQINFHGANLPKVLATAMVDVFKSTGKQFIFQVDGVNDDLIKEWVEAGCGNPLFDISGGIGRTPAEMKASWPTAWPGVYCGYAGGMSPDNVLSQLELIAPAAGNEHIWIDMETRVRSRRDRIFDLFKCEQVLKAVQPQIQE